MNQPLAYLNGRFLPFAQAALPLHDAGFVSGATIVDNARTFRHKLFRWEDHLRRFSGDCAQCYVPLEATYAELNAVAEELVAHNAKLLPPGGELQLVTFATPGPLGFYVGETANGPGTLGMVTYPLPFARYRPFFTDGVTLAVVGVQHNHPDDFLQPRVKHRSRLVWHMAGQVVKDATSKYHVPGAVPVVVNENAVGDTAIGTILAVADGAVFRPEAGTVLDGISAKVVAELCETLGQWCVEGPIDLMSLSHPDGGEDDTPAGPASEVLLAGTGFCLAGVRRVATGRRHRDSAWPGPVFRRLLAAWSDLVGLDVAAQFTAGA